MYFIGDVHGRFERYQYIIKNNKIDHSIQLGDMGIGFPTGNKEYNFDNKTFAPDIGDNHRFIRGNHDDPELCMKHPRYLGDYGYIEQNDIFYLSGGLSIDKHCRIEFIDWWRNEELNLLSLQNASELYEQHKPSIIVSHECPTEIKIKIGGMHKLKYISTTERLLQHLLEIHRPKYWIFGHYHKKEIIEIDGTTFVVLDELIRGKEKDCIFEIPNVKF
ncbi:MAG: metallophosphoesterase [archaeon]